jgi:ADP-dependent NAD(P)H-hydrate dehydratase / NAD(P)H-hydrate epimerase
VNWPAVAWREVPTVLSSSLRRADADARARFGIEALQLMEIAGWQVARFVDAFQGGIRGRHVTVVAGAGNNGGDALAAARFLLQRGAMVGVSMVPPTDGASLVAHHASTVRRMGIVARDAPDGIGGSTDLIIDGLLGTGIRPPLREPASHIIAVMNGAGRPIVAIDVPSGLDADTGLGAQGAIRATATVTLVAPKPGLAGARNAGRVFLADLGMPATLFGAQGAALADLYAVGDLIELVDPERRLVPDTSPS